MFGSLLNITQFQIHLHKVKSGTKITFKRDNLSLFLLPTYSNYIMELTSKDGNMVVDFYPVKNWDNEIIHNRILKVLSFRGDQQKKMLISRDEFYYQVREYIKECKYQVTNEYMPAQYITT